jgi:hypothetical protein
MSGWGSTSELGQPQCVEVAYVGVRSTLQLMLREYLRADEDLGFATTQPGGAACGQGVVALYSGRGPSRYPFDLHMA